MWRLHLEACLPELPTFEGFWWPIVPFLWQPQNKYQSFQLLVSFASNIYWSTLIKLLFLNNESKDFKRVTQQCTVFISCHERSKSRSIVQYANRNHCLLSLLSELPCFYINMKSLRKSQWFHHCKIIRLFCKSRL